MVVNLKYVLLIAIVRQCICIVHCPNNCSYSGRCNTRTGQCTCLDGHYGTDCSGDCGCHGNGVCKSDHTCQCHDGWAWSAANQSCVWDCQCPHGLGCIAPGVCGCQHTCQYGACWNGQCECWVGYTGALCTHLDPLRIPSRNVSVGINLGGITYYSTEFKFVDIAKQSQSWVTERLEGSHAHEWDSHEQTSVQWREDGYPATLDETMLIGKLMYRTHTPHPGGNYTILHEGEGEIDIHLVHHTKHYDGKGKIIANMSPGSGGIMLQIKRTNPANPIRNVRVIQPGFELRYDLFAFNPLFLETLTRYSEFRFMDFLHTNAHQPEPTTWATRRKMDYHTQGGDKGGALEYMILLCNIMGSNAWFNIPHAADDDFVMNMATLIKRTLRPDVKVYVEYSNEVWNGIFRQTRYTQEQGLKMKLDSHGYRAGMKYYNLRSSQVMDIFKNAFGDDTRVFPVWSWQTGYEDFTRQALEDLGNRTSYFKALAITGYFSCDSATVKHKQEFVNMTMAQISDLCKIGLTKTRASYQHYMNVAMDHGWKLVMYEGGPSVMEPGAISHGSSNGPVTDKAIAFNRDPHVEDSTLDVLNTWKQIVTDQTGNGAPGGLFNYFSSCGSPSKYGSWGMIEYTGQNVSSVPKYRAVQKFISANSGHDVLGPKCSFVQHGSDESYGCFRPNTGHTGHWKCGKSLNRGDAWLYLPDLSVHGNISVLVLDGYNPVSHTLFVRLINEIGGNAYHTADTKSNQWKTETSWEYHRMLASGDVTRRLPDGVTHGLDKHVDCVYRIHASLAAIG